MESEALGKLGSRKRSSAQLFAERRRCQRAHRRFLLPSPSFPYDTQTQAQTALPKRASERRPTKTTKTKIDGAAVAGEGEIATIKKPAELQPCRAREPLFHKVVFFDWKKGKRRLELRIP